MSHGFLTPRRARASLWEGAIVTQSGDQTITNNTATSVLFDTETLDTAGFHDTGSNTERLTVPSPGMYLIEAGVNWDSASNGVRSTNIYKNGTTAADEIAWSGDSTVFDGYGATITTMQLLAANDFVLLRAYHNEGASRTLRATFKIWRIG